MLIGEINEERRHSVCLWNLLEIVLLASITQERGELLFNEVQGGCSIVVATPRLSHKVLGKGPEVSPLLVVDGSAIENRVRINPRKQQGREGAQNSV